MAPRARRRRRWLAPADPARRRIAMRRRRTATRRRRTATRRTRTAPTLRATCACAARIRVDVPRRPRRRRAAIKPAMQGMRGMTDIARTKLPTRSARSVSRARTRLSPRASILDATRGVILRVRTFSLCFSRFAEIGPRTKPVGVPRTRAMPRAWQKADYRNLSAGLMNLSAGVRNPTGSQGLHLPCESPGCRASSPPAIRSASNSACTPSRPPNS